MMLVRDFEQEETVLLAFWLEITHSKGKKMFVTFAT